MALAPGSRVGVYEVTARIGVGGMGEVWRGTDTTLGRQVAIKILPDAFAADPERLARFEREAKTLAALNHPHIAAIYGFEKSSGVHALVMELVEGDDLSERIARGAMPLDEALPIAKQIAEALEAAHEQGIIHRDLKPANIKVRTDGTVKVLDFGLAKAMDPPAGSSPNVSQFPTITTPAMTQAGMILGTAAYMAPEQARGKVVDKRADIWAFGAVLFEMLTGRRAFPGEDLTDTLAAVVKLEPNWDALGADVPARVRQAVRVCLQKDPRQRAQAIGDVRLVLEGGFEITPPSAVAPSSLWRRVATSLAAFLFGALAASALTFVLIGDPDRPGEPEPRSATRFAIALPPATQLDSSSGRPFAISRNGRRVVYIGAAGGRSQLYVRPLDQLDSRAVPGAGVDVGDDIRNVFLSPDGEWVGYQAGPATLKKVRIGGGPQMTICDDCSVSGTASWGAGGTIVFSGSAGLMQVSEAGGVPTPLTTPRDESHIDPQFLPDGKALLFTVRRQGSPDRIAARSFGAGERHVLLEGAVPRFATGGYIVFQRQDALWAVGFDPGRLQIVGAAVPVLEGVSRTGLNNGKALFDLAADGSLVYAPNAVRVRTTMVWIDRRGRESPIAAPIRGYATPRLSPDGTRVALTITDQDLDIGVWDLARESLTRFTFDKAMDMMPVWTPDGRRVVFSSNRDGAQNLYWQSADGTGPLERLTKDAGSHTAFGFTPDASRLLFRHTLPNAASDLSILTVSGDGRIQPLLHSAFAETNGRLSSDGRWLAYMSNESGRYEVYVRPFPDVETGRWQISNDGGSRPVWARSGRELFYVAPGGSLMAVPIRGGPTFDSGSPAVLFDATAYFEGIGANADYDVSLDGQRFLMVKQGGAVDAPGLVVVQDWLGELQRTVPTK